VGVAEATRLLGAPGGVVARVEVDHDRLLALEPRQGDRFAVLVLQGERRRRLALLDCHFFSFETWVCRRSDGGILRSGPLEGKTPRGALVGGVRRPRSTLSGIPPIEGWMASRVVLADFGHVVVEDSMFSFRLRLKFRRLVG